MGRKQKIRRGRGNVKKNTFSLNTSSSNNNGDNNSKQEPVKTLDLVTAALADVSLDARVATSATNSSNANAKAHVTSSCYHGSNKESFENVEYQKAAFDYMKIMHLQKSSGGMCHEFPRLLLEFDRRHGRLLRDEEFCKFLFALAARMYLQSNGKNRGGIVPLLNLGFNIRYSYIPVERGIDVVPGTACYEKVSKYQRDIMTERGLINCLARETPCDCMRGHKKEAKSMEKLGFCYGCRRQFSKESMFLCSRCKAVNYCSRECQLKDWPLHQDACGIMSETTNNNKATCGAATCGCASSSSTTTTMREGATETSTVARCKIITELQPQ